LREAGNLYVDMAADPEFAQKLFDRFVEFELKHYERILMAADGQIDILRCYDNYGTHGTQTGMLFSPAMWKMFFKANTKK
jgi:uroporphyrinogen decarboxylase